ncbi:hypothetical protein [Paracnuella aquatica]|uniref:hypothetical protein n=1 Tax=Paracnuella aquatica TaxID=2268757 RepID=UPI000F50E8FC|nr:hypothetical protein [Paracnuella aquatica]RPD45085.1 hypothetical protein DRJ53_15685 [Paracnuella aquatica]
MRVKSKVFGLSDYSFAMLTKMPVEATVFDIYLFFQLQIYLMQKGQITAGRKNRTIIFPNCPQLYSNTLSVLPTTIES